ncbi:ABC transporter ATP-binding protein [[Pseudomonas] boreopolis]|uniref:ABC transporter ATP-binding protein n=1 Tax=Xanthomonas boreopolis TaxID=86183 RepID=UPI003D41020F
MTQRYGSKVALENVSLMVATGTFFALLGPNGAGKTTTIRLMSTLTRPTSGSVVVGGCDVVKDAIGVRRQIGVVFQNNSLDDELTVGENLHVHALIQSLDSRDAARRSEELLELVGMAAHRRKIVRGLSGGEKRRIEIARALLHRPKILYLDEPTVGLDAQVRNVLWSYLKQSSATEGVTVVFTTHYLEEAEANADTVAVIKGGQLLACDTAHALRQAHDANGLTEAYLRMTGGAPA